MNATFLAVDLETTGLEAETDRILEVAAVALTSDFEEVWRYHAVVPTGSATLAANQFTLEMHLKTGLIEKSGTGYRIAMGAGRALRLSAIEDEIVARLPETFKRKPIIAGNSIDFDKKFIVKHMPRLAAQLHYRMMDARSVMMLAPEIPWPEPTTSHRAMDDIERSIGVFRLGRKLALEGYYARVPEAKPGHEPKGRG